MKKLRRKSTKQSKVARRVMCLCERGRGKMQMRISECMFQCASVYCLCRFAMRLCCCAICMCDHTYIQQLINSYSVDGWNSCEGGIVCSLTLVASVQVTYVLQQVCACTNKVCACGTNGPKSKTKSHRLRHPSITSAAHCPREV